MLPSFARQTVTRLRPGYTDDGHGNQIPGLDDAEPLTITGCSIQPGTSTEDRTNRDTIGITHTVYLPAGSDVQANDYLAIDGTAYRVVGEPERWNTGVLNHVRVYLQRWEG